MVVVVVSVVAITVTAKNSSSTGSGSSTFTGSAGSIVLTNSNAINFPADNATHPWILDFKTVSSITSELFSYDTSNNQISVLKSGNYVVSIYLAPEDNTIAATDISVFPGITMLSNATGKAVLLIQQTFSIFGSVIGEKFAFVYSSGVYLPQGDYSITGYMILSSQTGNPPFLVNQGSASFTISA